LAHEHDIQHFIDKTHVWVEGLLDNGACPSCLAQAMISEGFHLAAAAGALDLAKETADRYANGDGGPVLSEH
jgi:hypothetical protein